jgi:DNA-binding transcriptional regulator GbsR (MarR family)
VSPDCTEEKQHFIEEVGLFFEHFGITRMAGRMLGALLICDPPYLSMNEIADALQASKGSISAASRLLLQSGLVERFSRPGERRDYYRVQPGAWFEVMKKMLDEITLMRELAELGLQLIEGEAAANRTRLESMRRTFSFFEREFPVLLDDWQRQAKAD